MTDDELIEWLMRNLQFRSDILPEFSKRLIALARIGAAVQPRPIEEAPKDGTWLMLYIPGHGYARAAWHKIGWYSHGAGKLITRATHFFLYDALPKPQEQT